MQNVLIKKQLSFIQVSINDLILHIWGKKYISKAPISHQFSTQDPYISTTILHNLYL